jgi:hypothetical protein
LERRAKMQIQSLLPHKKGTGVLVNGHTYMVAQDLVIRDAAGAAVDVPEADATKLLTNATAWAVFNPVKAPVAAKPRAEKPRMALIASTGDVIPLPPVVPAQEAPVAQEIPPPPADSTRPDLAVSAVLAAQDAFEAKKLGELPDEGTVADPPIPGPDDEWADPEATFSLSWLQACAKAYKIKYKGKDKTALIEKIKAAMYE